MSKKYLIVMKNPPVSFMVDSFESANFLKNVKSVSCMQEDLILWIPVDINSNISYIQEMSDEDVKAMEEKILKQRAKLEIVKPGFKIPKKRFN